MECSGEGLTEATGHESAHRLTGMSLAQHPPIGGKLLAKRQCLPAPALNGISARRSLVWALLRKPMGMSAFMGFAMWSPVPGLPHAHCGSQTSPFTHSDASGPGHTEKH